MDQPQLTDEEKSQNEADNEAIAERGKMSRAILQLVRKSRIGDQGLVAKLSGEFGEDKVKQHIGEMVASRQMYLEGQGESAAYRAGEGQ